MIGRLVLSIGMFAAGVGASGHTAVGQVPERIGTLEGIRSPSTMAADGNDLFVVGEDRLVRVYSIQPFSLRFTVGGSGDGPRELRYRPGLWVTARALVVSDFTKSLWFTRGGEFVKALSYSDFPDFNTGQEMRLFPVGDRLVRSIVDHAARRKTVTLLDSALRPLATLYEGLYDWNQLGGPSGFNLLMHRIEVVAGDREIYVSDTDKGFFVRVFDLDGETTATIDRTSSEAAVAVSSADRDRLLDEVRPTLPANSNVLTYVQANARVPDTFPRIHHVRYAGGRLYVTTHRKRDDLHEMLVLDRRGRILDRLLLPIPSFHHYRGEFDSDLFAVSGGAVIELVQNPQTRSWEVMRTRLSR